MNNLFKVILLCAILSSTFTPCFSDETLNTHAEEISNLPLAVPEEISSSYEEKIKNDKTSKLSSDENILNDDNNLQTAQSNMADKNEVIELIDKEQIAACPVSNDLLFHKTGTIDAFKSAYKCLYGKELTAVVLEKGRKFEVKSLQPMSFESSSGTEVVFESIYPERVFLDKDPAKLIFKGEVIKNKPPRKGGGSGTLKVKITGLQVENVTYPTEAYISKMNKKNVMFGAVAVPSNYKDNLADTVNNGTINNYYNMDPCNKVHDECVSAVAKPFYFLTGAILQTADLFIAPVIAFFAPGKEVYIPEGTEFEIKIEGDVPILDL